MMLSTPNPTFSSDRAVARRIGVHVMARARRAAVGRIDLAPTAGGFGTPAFGDDHRVVRLSGDLLAVDSTADVATTRIMHADGASLRQLAAFVGVDLSTPLDVGHDTPPLGDIDEPLRLAAASVALIGEWLALGARVLDTVLAALPSTADPARVRLWPEHFDLGTDVGVGAGRRVNLGVSPGDDFHAAPYLYIAPWDPDRPGDPAYWNAPFGAVLGYDDVAAAPDVITPGVAFLRDGISRFD